MLTLKHWKADIQAGLGTAIVMLPQAMAYALLAGLSPVHGLYAATLPVLFYGFFGGADNWKAILCIKGPVYI